MEIRLSRSEFLDELMPMQGIVERRSTIPVLSHILLRVAEGRLHVSATDLDVSLTTWCEGKIARDGGIAVQARKFIEIVRSLVGDDVQLALEDDSRLRIAAGQSRFRINGLSPDDFPTLPKVTEKEVQELPFGELKRMIGKVLFAVSAEESRFQLNGALLNIQTDGFGLIATDGHRLALVENALKGGQGAEGILVPRKALQELQRFEGTDKLLFRKGEHHLSFETGRRELISRILEGTFPDYERVISKDNDKEASFERAALAAAIQRVALLTGDRARAVRLQFTDSLLVISATNPDLGDAVEELSCDYVGPEVVLGINPDYLGQFLSAVETERVRFQIKDENTQCVGLPVEGKDQRYLCVIMPMRV